jgi:hypothetical protein
MEAYRCLFPTIDFSRVRFFDGLPTPYNWGSQEASTVEYFSEQHICLRRFDPKDFCDSTFFLLIAHELVHVLQIQKGGSTGSWTARYLACYVAAGFSDQRGNCFEMEAYEYANGLDANLPGILKTAIDNQTLPVPCECSTVGMPAVFRDPNTGKSLCDVVHEHPDLPKKSTRCGYGDCLAEAINSYGILGVLLDILAIIISAIAAFIGIGGFNTGTIVGAGLGLTAGALIGFAFGGPLGALVFGFLGAILGAFLGGLIQDFFDWLTGGDSGGGLNVAPSRDGGATFEDKGNFERTREQMALVFGLVLETNPDGASRTIVKLYVAWTGLDDQVNVRTFKPKPGPPGTPPDTTKVTFERANHCGPALARDSSTGTLVVAWQGNDGRLNFLTSTDDGVSFPVATKRTFDDARSPSDATPGLIFGDDGTLFFAWIDTSGQIHIWATADLGTSWLFKQPTGLATGAQGTAALAFGQGQVFLVWSDLGTVIQITIFQPVVGGLTHLSTRPLFTGVVETGDSDAGPAADYDPFTDRLFVAWTGPNRSDLLLASSQDFQNFTKALVRTPKGGVELSRSNAGPAVAALGSGVGGLVMYGWTGRG